MMITKMHTTGAFVDAALLGADDRHGCFGGFTPAGLRRDLIG